MKLWGFSNYAVKFLVISHIFLSIGIRQETFPHLIKLLLKALKPSSKTFLWAIEAKHFDQVQLQWSPSKCQRYTVNQSLPACKNHSINLLHSSNHLWDTQSGNWMGGGGESPLPLPFFWILEKERPIFWKKFTDCDKFLRVSSRKNWKFLPVRSFFFVLQMIVYQSALIPRKLPCPKKFLVAYLDTPVLNPMVWKVSTISEHTHPMIIKLTFNFPKFLSAWNQLISSFHY